jgi:purine-nucleoside phosphorylase
MVNYTNIDIYRNHIDEAARYLMARLGQQPEWGIVSGTGQSRLAERLEGRKGGCLYHEVPHFPRPTSPSHEGRLHWGRLAGKPVLIFQGRFHVYEGYSLQEVVMPVRVMAALGMKNLFISNAAGGLNPLFRSGELMLIADHINLIGDNPLTGPNVADWGPRFPDLSQAYDRDLMDLAEEVARRRGIVLRKGVYAAVQGPSLETPAETRFLRVIGADAVGMSTVPEVIAAVHAGLRIIGVSVISNLNLPDAMVPISLEEIIATVARAESQLVDLMVGLLEEA